LLDTLIELAPKMAVLLIVSFRPDFSAPWVGRPGVSLTTLSQLDRTAPWCIRHNLLNYE
jgi:hypothetical protein